MMAAFAGVQDRRAAIHLTPELGGAGVAVAPSTERVSRRPILGSADVIFTEAEHYWLITNACRCRVPGIGSCDGGGNGDAWCRHASPSELPPIGDVHVDQMVARGRSAKFTNVQSAQCRLSSLPFRSSKVAEELGQCGPSWRCSIRQAEPETPICENGCLRSEQDGQLP